MAVVFILSAYCVAGMIVAIWFSFFKISKIDEAASGSSIWFKIMIMPATILLWPVVMAKLNFKKK